MVFIEEIDTALYNKLSQIKIENKEIKVTHKYPDKDLLESGYPIISFTDYNFRKSKNQSNKHQMLVNVDKEKAKGILQENKTYYNVYYQIDYWAKFKTDINLLLTQHFKYLKPLGYIPVMDSNNFETEIPCSLQEGYKNLDEYKENNRLFRRSFSMKFVGYLDGDIEEVNLINKINLVRNNIIEEVTMNEHKK